MTEKQLFRVWEGWSTDWDGNRDEVMRILAHSYSQAFEFVKEKFIKPEYLDEVQDEEFGFSWDEEIESDCDEDTDDCPHYVYHYVMLDEIENWTEDDLSLNLLTETLGTTDEFYDLTEE